MEQNTISEIEATKKLSELICKPEGFIFDDEDIVGNGSWGRVYGIKSESLQGAVNGLHQGYKLGPGVAVKLPYGEDEINDDFARFGELAADCVKNEVEWGLRQLPQGIAPVIGRFWTEVNGEKIYFSDEPRDGWVAVPVMPWFIKNISDVVKDKITIDKEGVDFVMNDLMERQRLMLEPIVEGEELRLGSLKGVKNLIVDERMLECEDVGYPYCFVAEKVNSGVRELLKGLGGLVKQRQRQGKFGLVHGDGRFSNIAIAFRYNDYPSGVYLDAVRLGSKSENRMMKEWAMTDIMLQAGMTLGEMFVYGHDDWFKTGVEAYNNVFDDDVVEDKKLSRLFTAALIYGISVTVHTLNYRWYGAQSENEKVIIEKELEPLWLAMNKLATVPDCWKEILL